MKIITINKQNSTLQEARQRLESQAHHCVDQLIQLLRDKKMMVGFAESCTGGLLSHLVTRKPGVSDVYWGSVVSYANEAKHNILKVSEGVFSSEGAVSSSCAQAMVEGLLSQMGHQMTCEISSPANDQVLVNAVTSSSQKFICISITGVAGPTGGSATKPVGTVIMAVSGTNIATQIFHHVFQDAHQQVLDRELIQWSASLRALEVLIEILSEMKNFKGD